MRVVRPLGAFGLAYIGLLILATLPAVVGAGDTVASHAFAQKWGAMVVVPVAVFGTFLGAWLNRKFQPRATTSPASSYAPAIVPTTVPALAPGAVAAGWHLDQYGQMRWWDGQWWTPHVATAGPPAADRTGRVNPLAVVALVCSLIPTIGMVGIGLGVLALEQIKAQGSRGRIPAIIGVTFGSLWFVGWALSAIALLATRP